MGAEGMECTWWGVTLGRLQHLVTCVCMRLFKKGIELLKIRRMKKDVQDCPHGRTEAWHGGGEQVLRSLSCKQSGNTFRAPYTHPPTVPFSPAITLLGMEGNYSKCRRCPHTIKVQGI